MIPLNEEDGIIEWVPNTLPFRNVLNHTYQREGIDPHRNPEISVHSHQPSTAPFRSGCTPFWLFREDSVLHPDLESSVRLTNVSEEHRAWAFLCHLPRFFGFYSFRLV